MRPTKEEYLQGLILRHGAEFQEKLLQSSVAICGLGGLGSLIAICLARAGVGSLHLIDFDVVDVQNLNRQQYLFHQVGMPKTDALKKNLLEINPFCNIKTSQIKLTDENIPDLLSEESIICEAFDLAEQKAMLVNRVLQSFPNKYLVSASGMAGMESANSIQTKKISSHFYLCGDFQSDVNTGLGLISGRVAVCGAHQATMILRLIKGETMP